MTGDLAAITCALSFALCSMAFAAAGRRVGSLMVNQVRIFLAVLLLCGAHWILLGAVWPSTLSAEQLWLLVASGVIGLALGDLCYFHSLTVLGPRLGTLMMSTFPLFVVLVEGIWRRHWPTAIEGAFMTAIIAGVMLVLTGKRVASSGADGAFGWAIVAGLLGAVGQGVGLVLARLAFDASVSASPADSLSVTVVRMIAGLGGMAVIVVARMVVHRGAGPRRARKRPMTTGAFGLIFIGVVFGPTLGVWLSMVAVQTTDAGRASVLIALTPVLMLPIAWFGYHEKPTARSWFGTTLAFVGTAALLAAAA